MTTHREDGYLPSHEDEAPAKESTATPGKAVDADDPYYAKYRLLLAEEPFDSYDSTWVCPMHLIPRTWRQLVHTAARQVCANTQLSDAEYVVGFERRHGPCSIANLAALAHRWADVQRPAVSASEVVVEDDEEESEEESEEWSDEWSKEEDTEFVLLMLGVWPEHPQAELAREALIPFLASLRLRERIESAISLSHLRDDRAIPALIALLTDGLPEPEPWGVQTEAEARERWDRFDDASFHAEMVLRQEVPAILARWGIRDAIPILRQTLQQTARIERTEAHWDPYPKWDQYWQRYQGELVGALARLGAFGALIGIEPPQGDDDTEPTWVPRSPKRDANAASKRGTQRLYQWRIFSCLDIVAQRFEYAGRRGEIPPEQVRPEVEQLLGELFGLDENERRAALEPYYDYQFRLELY